MIDANTANALANVCSEGVKQKMFQKTIEEIEFCIRESAKRGHYSISYNIPLRIREEVVKYLEELGYSVYAAPVDCIDNMSGYTYWINW